MTLWCFDDLDVAAYSLHVPRGSEKGPKKEEGGKRDNVPEGKRRVTLYLAIGQARALKVMAAQQDRDMSSLVAEFLEKCGVK